MSATTSQVVRRFCDVCHTKIIDAHCKCGEDRDPVNRQPLYALALAHAEAVHEGIDEHEPEVTYNLLEAEFRRQGMIRPDEQVNMLLDQAIDRDGGPCHGIYVYPVVPGSNVRPALLFLFVVED